MLLEYEIVIIEQVDASKFEDARDAFYTISVWFECLVDFGKNSKLIQTRKKYALNMHLHDFLG